MLTKYKNVRPKKYFAKCFHIFSSVDIFGRIILKHNENEKGPRGVRGDVPRKIFENLHTVVAILVLFEQFVGKFCLNFLPLNMSVSPNMTHFVSTFSIMRA